MKCDICSDHDKLQTLKTKMLLPLILILVLACSKLRLPLVPMLVFLSSKVRATQPPQQKALVGVGWVGELFSNWRTGSTGASDMTLQN